MSEAMSANHRLVEYFVSEFYRKYTRELAHITSNDFAFQLHNLPDQNFEKFADRMAYISSKATLTIGDIHTDDDVLFYANSSVCIVLAQGEDYVVNGRNGFVVKNGLLERVTVKYDLTDDEFEKMQQMLADGVGANETLEHSQDDIMFE